MEHIAEQISKLTDILEKIVEVNEKMVIKINALEEDNKRLWHEVDELKKNLSQYK
jgi:hypothetical protein